MDSEIISCHTHAQSISAILKNAIHSLDTDFRGRNIQAFEIYYEYEGHHDLNWYSSKQYVRFQLSYNRQLAKEDQQPQLTRGGGMIRVIFTLKLTSFLMNTEDIDNFHAEYVKEIQRLDIQSERKGGVWKIFRACKVKFIAGSISSDGLVLVKVEFEDNHKIKLDWKEKLALHHLTVVSG